MPRRKQGEPTGRALEDRIGYTFNDPARLEGALTHASARPAGGTDYQRLEFLGDRVLGLVVADWLYADYPTSNEGEMSVRLNALVNAETLAAIAEDIGLSEWIKAGRELRGVTGRKRVNMRSDVMEALIAAIYLDGGFEPARTFIRTFWKEHATKAQSARRDAKTELQEWAHQTRAVTPSYSVASRTGPDHDPVFVVKVAIAGVAEEQGTGRSKREAEQAAARAVLIREAVWAADEETVNA
ncbi:ribonuclease III [Tianweitania populi]|uniref:Ribonuclease 3 n=1 Tax=Tianweitania populi TaxID=1607949 RepID=A0A8J3DN33_9HYPH|nr:ribonuclease III [Tianweitania populi]GHD06801.1 ribonuclease 3 [Tianweitania populi]